MTLLDRYRGALLGLAAGDALGTTLEFCAPGTFSPLVDIVGGGPFALERGQWTDDTSMALCLADSLIKCRGSNLGDQLERYTRWYREGYLSSTGRCFDIGNTVCRALEHFAETGDPHSGPTDRWSAGNGSIMRLAPVILFYSQYPRQALEQAAETSRTTHGTLLAVDACRYFGALILGALHGVPKEQLLGDHYSPVPGYWQDYPLAPEIDEIASGSFRHRNPPAIQGTGYVVHSLEAALWAFDRSDSYREGALLAANLGNDADTTGAVYGQLAGAYYGEQGIPASWRQKLAQGQRIADMAEQLYTLALQLDGD